MKRHTLWLPETPREMQSFGEAFNASMRNDSSIDTFMKAVLSSFVECLSLQGSALLEKKHVIETSTYDDEGNGTAGTRWILEIPFCDVNEFDLEEIEAKLKEMMISTYGSCDNVSHRLEDC